MATVESIKKEMIETGKFKAEDLSFITDDLLKEAQSSSKDFDQGSIVSRILLVNSFYISAGIWNWFDGPGDPCGRRTHWTWKPSPGSTYVGRGKCRNGYPMFELNLY